VAFTVVRYRTEQYGEHEGVATTWLYRLCDGIARGQLAPAGTGAQTPPRLPVFLRRGGAFAPPASLATPLVMIGPGTGVTPFRGFLQHRRAQLKEAAAGGGEPVQRGAAWLYFGCRRQDQDYLYREDLEVRYCSSMLYCCTALLPRQPCCLCARLPATLPSQRLLPCGGSRQRRDDHDAAPDVLPDTLDALCRRPPCAAAAAGFPGRRHPGCPARRLLASPGAQGVRSAPDGGARGAAA
jgi:hypothetical protein